MQPVIPATATNPLSARNASQAIMHGWTGVGTHQQTITDAGVHVPQLHQLQQALVKP